MTSIPKNLKKLTETQIRKIDSADLVTAQVVRFKSFDRDPYGDTS